MWWTCGLISIIISNGQDHPWSCAVAFLEKPKTLVNIMLLLFFLEGILLNVDFVMSLFIKKWKCLITTCMAFLIVSFFVENWHDDRQSLLEFLLWHDYFNNLCIMILSVLCFWMADCICFKSLLWSLCYNICVTVYKLSAVHKQYCKLYTCVCFHGWCLFNCESIRTGSPYLELQQRSLNQEVLQIKDNHSLDIFVHFLAKISLFFVL